ncbi:MAG: AMP-binding protein [Chloroflexi bacterium]|nr:AMP-binding protein [Chloroflexota bacterium]
MELYNIAQSLTDMAARAPFRPAVIFPAGRDDQGRAKFVQFSFQQLNQECDRYAHGLTEHGIRQGDRTLVMIRPGVELIAVAFALLKMGAVPVMIDPGMGQKPFRQCVAETEPVAFIGIPPAHVLRVLFPKPFQTVKHVVTVGKRWFWGGATLDQVRSEQRDPFPVAPTTTESESAIAFTSGSTGIPKGVVYLQGMFRAQIELLQKEFRIAEGEVDLPGLYIFALFNPALGVTTVFPDMDPTKPAQVNPAYLVEAIQTHGVTNSFGSPAIWKRVGQYCLENNIQLPSIKRILMASAPVPPSLVADFEEHILDGGEVNTPFGASESVPITMMSGSEIVAETAALSDQGWGMCVGREIRGHTIRIIRVTDEPIAEWSDGLMLPQGEIGEIVVKGPVVTRVYLNRPQQTASAKIRDVDGVWHRMGDLGYLDEKGRLWFCGRKAHRIETSQGLMLPVPCEAIFNHHPDVIRTALVGVGERGQERPMLIVEPHPNKKPSTKAARAKFIAELLALGAAHEQTRLVQDILFSPVSFPVDVRHNAKIQREKLAVWAETQLSPSQKDKAI